jgi:fatty acid desaturase
VTSERAQINVDWAELQLRTTQDYAHGSWFWTTFTGALNHQSTHHLVPGIHQYYYSTIVPLIQRVATQHGVKYLCMDTFADALGSHISYLKTMGQSPKKSN